MEPGRWWTAVGNQAGVDIPKSLVQIAIRLHNMPSSSASIERIFSNFGHIQSKLRNRLGVQKCAKLVLCFRMLRGKMELDY